MLNYFHKEFALMDENRNSASQLHSIIHQMHRITIQKHSKKHTDCIDNLLAKRLESVHISKSQQKSKSKLSNVHLIKQLNMLSMSSEDKDIHALNKKMTKLICYNNDGNPYGEGSWMSLDSINL